MEPRQIARATSFGPDELRVIFEAFDDAWSEIAPKVGTDPAAVEGARMALATIVLRLASTGSIAPSGLATLAVAAFGAKHRIEVERVA
jgi:hypothetical protein